MTERIEPDERQISVIIPTLNESEMIGDLITYIFTYGGKLIREVIVVDGGSKDTTVTLAREAGAMVITAGIRSRATQMNLGAERAMADILYFIHADIHLVPTFAGDILESVQNGSPAGCFRFRFDSGNPLLKINSYCTRFKGIMCRGGDQTLFITNNLFHQLLGFDEYFTIMEDFDFIERIRAVASFRIIPKSIGVSARKYENNSWLRVQLSNFTVFMMYFMKRDPDQMRSVYNRLLNYR